MSSTTINRLCVVCSQPIQNRIQRAIYCGPNCNQVATYRRRHGTPIENAACLVCGTLVTAGSRGTKPRHCSARCRSRAAYDRAKAAGSMQAASALRRARKRTTQAVLLRPHDIFERDAWRCGICGEGVDRTATYPAPRSASLDHIVPLADGGPHEPDNVRCSHLRCNIVRGNQLRKVTV